MPVTAYGQDVNGYTPTYAASVTIPTPTDNGSGDGPDCTGASEVNPDASDEYIIKSNAGWAQINNTTYQYFFVCPGDYTSEGTITITQDGTSGNEQYLVWWTDSNYDAGDNYRGTAWEMGNDKTGAETCSDPNETLSDYTEIESRCTKAAGTLGSSDVAKVERILMSNADYWIIDRLVFEPDGDNGFDTDAASNSQNYVLQRSWFDCAGTGTTGNPECVNLRDSQDATLQYNVVAECRPTDNTDNAAFDMSSLSGDDNISIVGNEVFDCGKSGVEHGDQGNDDGHVIENNDFYVTTNLRMGCGSGNAWDGTTLPFTSSAAHDANGKCGCYERPGFGTKSGSDTVGDPFRIIHNRAWGGREQGYTTSNGQACGGSGAPQGTACSVTRAGGTPAAEFVVLENNIVSDSEVGCTINGAGGGDDPANNTFRGNFFHDIEDFATQSDYSGSGTAQSSAVFKFISGSDDTQIVYNTIVNSETQVIDGSETDFDFSANVMVDVGTVDGGGNPTKVDYNAYVGATTNPNYSGENNDYDDTIANADLQTYCYWRKLQTEREQVCVESVVPTTSSPLVGVADGYSPNQASYGWPNLSW